MFKDRSCVRVPVLILNKIFTVCALTITLTACVKVCTFVSHLGNTTIFLGAAFLLRLGKNVL